MSRNTMRTLLRAVVLLCLWTGASHAQIKWEHITGNPYSIGTTTPATCTVGDVFFKTNATAGQNLYLCSSTNTWTLVTGTPIAHASSHATDGSDPVTIAQSQVTNLTTALSGKEPTITAGTTAQYWRGDKSWQALNSTAVGLGNVENTALSTWAGSASIATLGSVTVGSFPWANLTGKPTFSAANTASAVVQRDASGNFAASTITANLSGTASAVTNGVYTSGSYTDPSWLTLTKSKVGLGSVENTALSTWAGSANLTTVGTLASGGLPWSLVTGAPSTYAPTAHASNHASAGSDPVTLAQSQVTNLTTDLSGKEPTITAGTTGQYWRGDKSWQTLPNDMVYPGAGVPNSTGSTWGTSYTVGTAANNLVQLNGSAQLPAVSAALLTNFPTFNQNTSGTAAGLSATLALASGGTNQTSWTASRCVQVAADGTKLESAAGACGGGDVSSVFGRTGAVVATANDYSFSQISGTAAVNQGGTGADLSAASGFLRVSSGSVSAAGLANSDLPDAFDISGKTSTKPVKSGTTAPETCSVGEMFFDTDATAPFQLYTCTATNTWKVAGGSGVKAITLFDPVTGDSGRVQFMFPTAVTITRVACSVKAATSVTIDLDERAAATPDTSGTAVLTSTLACDTDQAVTTSFSNAGIAAEVPVALLISAVSGTPNTLRVYVSYQVN